MKKTLLLAAFAVFGLTSINAQDGGFNLGANIGFPLIPSSSGYDASFNFGFDASYLFGVIDKLAVGPKVGYTQFLGEGGTSYTEIIDGETVVTNLDYIDAAFIPVAGTARYHFNSDKMFAGVDLGVAISVTDEAKTGFYGRPQFGFQFGSFALIGSFQHITGGVDYSNTGNTRSYSGSGFNSFNIGVEYGF